MSEEDFKQAALDYHAWPIPGKLRIEITKPANTQQDLSLAYSPGVAEPVRAIAQDPQAAYRYTGKGNLVGVVSNGTAILGLGNLGALASKPVMEGKALLFKRFANIDAIDIEINTEDVAKFVETVALIADTFGGINLEDIKAPECFEIERQLIERCSIPVFHDDQHGTAIVTVAGLLNALDIQGKTLADAKLVCLGAGSAAIACCNLLLTFGLKRDNIQMLDSKGVLHQGRTDLNEYKAAFAVKTSARTLDDAIENADIFLGLSGPDLLSADQLLKMAPAPIVFACSNPDPEIRPELAYQVRSDLVMATGRSDYPNQVNNALAFPYIFRGALDVRASAITEEMKIAAVHAIRNLAKQPVSDATAFGRDYILPTLIDPRLLDTVSFAVSRAAIASGVAALAMPVVQTPAKTPA